jgi:cell division protein FtsQ
MNRRKIIWHFAAYVFGVIAFFISVGFASHKQAAMPCSGIVVNIQDSIGSGFIEKPDILQTVQNKFGSLEGKPLNSINISLLEKIINTNPFISNAEVFSTVDGKINIDVKQRIPVLRVLNHDNESFYVDDKGVFMPLSENYTARVPLVNGFIFDREAEKKVPVAIHTSNDSVVLKTKLEEVFNVVMYTSQQDFWKDDIQQLYVNADGEIEIIPRIGNHSIIIGDDQQTAEKFNKLMIFYHEGLNKKGWDKYKTINLKYKDQVVCTKK